MRCWVTARAYCLWSCIRPPPPRGGGGILPEPGVLVQEAPGNVPVPVDDAEDAGPELQPVRVPLVGVVPGVALLGLSGLEEGCDGPEEVVVPFVRSNSSMMAWIGSRIAASLLDDGLKYLCVYCYSDRYMTRTEPIRVRTPIAKALRELTEGDETRISDFASTLLLLALFDPDKRYYKQLSPETQAALSAEVVDLLGMILKALAEGMRESGLSADEFIEKAMAQKAKR